MALTAANARNQIAAALGLNRQVIKVNKASLASQLAGAFTSLWLATGQPTAGVAPTGAALCTKATTGAALNFVNAGAGNALYLTQSVLAPGNGGTTFETHDRICHMGGLSGIVATAQTVNLDPVALGAATDRTGPVTGTTAFNALEWWIECYSALGATGVTATVTYTNGAGVTGRTTTLAIPASLAASRALMIVGSGGEAIASVQSVTLSATTGTAGNFGVTCTNRLSGHCGARTPVANWSDPQNWADLGLPLVGNNACLQWFSFNITTSSGTLTGDQYLVEI